MSRHPTANCQTPESQSTRCTWKIRLTAPPCGWTDLGTPRRVADVLRRQSHRASLHAGTPDNSQPGARGIFSRAAILDLAHQFARRGLVKYFPTSLGALPP
jgi:hypothetical protein